MNADQTPVVYDNGDEGEAPVTRTDEALSTEILDEILLAKRARTIDDAELAEIYCNVTAHPELSARLKTQLVLLVRECCAHRRTCSIVTRERVAAEHASDPDTLAAVIAEMHLSPTLFTDRRRLKSLVLEREMVYRQLRARGWTFERIGAVCGMHHSSVVKLLGRKGAAA